MTVPLIQELKTIHTRNFSSALQKIEKQQIKYKHYYDVRHKVKSFNLKIGDKVQYQRYHSKLTQSKLHFSKWTPLKSYYLILNINLQKKTVTLQTPQGVPLKRHQSFDRIRKFRGKF